jgi:glycosyltransferase involved in cell wall biosynthesis
MLTNLSVIIPAKNEEENLKKLIPALFKRYTNIILEIIVVNDFSTDHTKEVLTNLRKQYPKLKIIHQNSQSGVGSAIITGIRNLSPKSRYVLFMDCDFLVNVPDIAKMLEKIEDYDGVVGSRFLKKNSLKNYPLPKRLVNRLYHLLARVLLGVKQKDLTNNFKLYKKELVDRLYPMLSSHDFAINAELGFYPVLLGYRIGEIPVVWQERTQYMGLSKFKILRVGPSYLKVFLKLLFLKYTR